MLEDGVSFLSDAPTGYRTGFYEASSSEKSLRKGKPRRRPHMSGHIGPVYSTSMYYGGLGGCTF